MKEFSCPPKSTSLDPNTLCRLETYNNPGAPDSLWGEGAGKALGSPRAVRTASGVRPPVLPRNERAQGQLLSMAAGTAGPCPLCSPVCAASVGPGAPCFSPKPSHLTQGLSRSLLHHFQSSWGWRRLQDSPPGDTERRTPRSSWPGMNVGLHSARSHCSQAGSPWCPSFASSLEAAFPGPYLTEGGETPGPSWGCSQIRTQGLGAVRATA